MSTDLATDTERVTDDRSPFFVVARDDSPGRA